MTKLLPIFDSWSAGEVTPRIHNRFGSEAFQQGADTVRNMIATSHGPVERRFGTRFTAQVTAEGGRIVPFYVSQSTGFIITLTDDGNLLVNDQGGLVVWVI